MILHYGKSSPLPGLFLFSLENILVNNLYIVPSTMELAGAEVELININNRENILKEKI